MARRRVKLLDSKLFLLPYYRSQGGLSRHMRTSIESQCADLKLPPSMNPLGVSRILCLIFQVLVRLVLVCHAGTWKHSNLGKIITYEMEVLRQKTPL